VVKAIKNMLNVIPTMYLGFNLVIDESDDNRGVNFKIAARTTVAINKPIELKLALMDSTLLM
jgi:hypothetical protein